MKIVNVLQRSPEWHAWRASGKITATDCAIIMCESPYCTYNELLQKKLGLLAETEENDHMRRGVLLEDEARQFFEDISGYKMAPLCVEHQIRSWQAASLDGIDLEHKTMLEIKCPSNRNHELVKTQGLPGIYYLQIQHQLAVTGYKFSFYLSYCTEDPYVTCVFRNETWINKINEEEEKFYKLLMEKKNE